MQLLQSTAEHPSRCTALHHKGKVPVLCRPRVPVGQPLWDSRRLLLLASVSTSPTSTTSTSLTCLPLSSLLDSFLPIHLILHCDFPQTSFRQSRLPTSHSSSPRIASTQPVHPSHFLLLPGSGPGPLFHLYYYPRSQFLSPSSRVLLPVTLPPLSVGFLCTSIICFCPRAQTGGRLFFVLAYSNYNPVYLVYFRFGFSVSLSTRT